MLRLALKNIKHNFVQKKVLTYSANLKIRNSESLQIQIPPTIGQNQSTWISVPKTSTLGDLTTKLQEQLQLTGIIYLCNEKNRLPSSTPIDILLNRYFYITTNEYFTFTVEGELFDYGRSDEIVQGIISLQLPAVSKREVQNYLTRVNRWIEFHTGKNMLDDTTRIDSNILVKILVDSIIDPQPQERKILDIQQEWQRVYWEVVDLKKKKRAADDLCLKKVRTRMSWGLMFLGGNIAFIWSGTYIFYSWDIIEPLAYFVSSLGAIVLASQFFKLGRVYSNYAYQQYLIDKISPKVYAQVGFDMKKLTNAEYHLVQLESVLKDHYLKRL